MDQRLQEQTSLGRCWACGRTHVRPGDPPEHIVPASLGGSLTTPRFARECNEELGRLVDQPFANDFIIAVSRARHRIPDRRRRLPPNPKHHAKTPEGRPVIFDWRDGSMYLPPHIVEDGESLVVSAETEEQAREAAQTKLERLGRGGEKFRLNRPQRKKPSGPLTAKMSLSLSSTIRAKAAAKIALGALSLVLDDDWLDTDSAQLLQGWLWDDPPKLPNGGTIFAAPKKVPYPFDKFCRSPEHLLWCFPGERQRTKFAIALFGEEFMVVDAGPLDDPSMDIAWALDPVAQTWEVTSFWDLILRGREAYEQDMAAAGWITAPSG